jgi:hypothetical protein
MKGGYGGIGGELEWNKEGWEGEQWEKDKIVRGGKRREVTSCQLNSEYQFSIQISIGLFQKENLFPYYKWKLPIWKKIILILYARGGGTTLYISMF